MKKTENPHLKILENWENYVISLIDDYNKQVPNIKLLDIGGGKGWEKVLREKEGIDYYCLDVKCNATEKVTFIQGDITDSDLSLPCKFDVIFTKDTFEHILNPWDATKNILNGLKENGLFIFLAPFSWRYHPSPYDTYRYTHTGAQYLFERLGGMEKVAAGYIEHGSIGGFWKNKKDWTFDGKTFVNCLKTIYIGKRNKNYEFSLDSLDSDFDWKHC